MRHCTGRRPAGLPTRPGRPPHAAPANSVRFAAFLEDVNVPLPGRRAECADGATHTICLPRFPQRKFFPGEARASPTRRRFACSSCRPAATASTCTPSFKGGDRPCQSGQGQAQPAEPRRTGQRRSAQPVRPGRRLDHGQVLHHPRLGVGDDVPALLDEDGSAVIHSREPQRSHSTARQRCGRAHRLRHHRQDVARHAATLSSPGGGLAARRQADEPPACRNLTFTSVRHAPGGEPNPMPDTDIRIVPHGWRQKTATEAGDNRDLQLY